MTKSKSTAVREQELRRLPYNYTVIPLYALHGPAEKTLEEYVNGRRETTETSP